MADRRTAHAMVSRRPLDRRAVTVSMWQAQGGKVVLCRPDASESLQQTPQGKEETKKNRRGKTRVKGVDPHCHRGCALGQRRRAGWVTAPGGARSQAWRPPEPMLAFGQRKRRTGQAAETTAGTVGAGARASPRRAAATMAARRAPTQAGAGRVTEFAGKLLFTLA